MDKAAFSQQQEPAITGELVREMRAYLELGPAAPVWAANYSIHDDPPLNTDGRLGSSRRRVDIVFERLAPGTRPRLQFEAKRLDSNTGHTVAGYLGGEGLGCFLSGRYPLTHSEAGMLGYVQSASEEAWAKKIAFQLSANSAAYGVELPPFERQRIVETLDHTWVSHHRRSFAENLITVHHILLSF
jgi:hypothetical protein